LYFTACGLGLMGLSAATDALEFVGSTESAKQQLLYRLLAASDFCTHHKAGHSTDLGFWLCLDNCIFASQVLGDSDYSVWRKLGDISTMVFAQGLHEDSKPAPFWLKEMRRRGLAYAYGSDKVLSTFVGRPPRISKRYCKIHIPLDLESAELALEGEDLAQVLSQLDNAGWNTTRPTSTRSSSGPMYVAAALIREEVLELCLGIPQDDLEDRARSLIKRSRALYASYPKRLQYDPSQAVHDPPSFTAVHSYLDHIYNEFVSACGARSNLANIHRCCNDC
jgi:chromatin structure-remodeling complex subunit RSC3/30